MAHRREWLKPLDVDQSTFTEVVEEWDGRDKKLILRTIEHEQAVADRAAELRQLPQSGTKVGGARMVALTPQTRYMRWKREWAKHWSDTLSWQSFKDWKLEQPENAAFRVHPSRNRIAIMERMAGIRARSA